LKSEFPQMEPGRHRPNSWACLYLNSSVIIAIDCRQVKSTGQPASNSTTGKDLIPAQFSIAAKPLNSADAWPIQQGDDLCSGFCRQTTWLVVGLIGMASPESASILVIARHHSAEAISVDEGGRLPRPDLSGRGNNAHGYTRCRKSPRCHRSVRPGLPQIDFSTKQN